MGTHRIPARERESGRTRQASPQFAQASPTRLSPTFRLRRDAGDLEAAGLAIRTGRLGDPRFQRQLLLEVRRLAMGEGDVLALEQLDEDLDEAGVQLFAGDAAELDD